MQSVIVYDLPGQPGLTFYVPAAWALKFQGPEVTLQQALAQVAAEALPPAATNLVFTSADQLPTLWQAQNSQLALLRAACQNEITGGYVSSALGAPFTYPSTQIDQSNMMASVIASMLPGLPQGWTTPFWCADANGLWAMRDHTASQIQQAGADGKLFISARQLKLATLGAEVMAAATVADAKAIAW